MQEIAKKILLEHNNLVGINDEVIVSKYGKTESVRSLESRFLSVDGLGSAGFELEGFLEEYEKKNQERYKSVEEIKVLRVQAGEDKQEELISELSKLPNSERAVSYVRKVPFPKLEAEVTIKRDGEVIVPKPPETEKKAWKLWR